MLFIELSLFRRYLQLADDELRAVQREIVDNPLCGDLIPGGRGLRKMRAAIGEAGGSAAAGASSTISGPLATAATWCLPIRRPTGAT